MGDALLAVGFIVRGVWDSAFFAANAALTASAMDIVELDLGRTLCVLEGAPFVVAAG